MSTPDKRPLPRLLVVDDEKDQLASLKVLFSRDFQVCVAESTAQARKFALDSFDAAIVDYHMPGENGTILLDELASFLPESRLFAYTADAAVADAAGVTEGWDRWRWVFKTEEPENLLRFVLVGMRQNMLKGKKSSIRASDAPGRKTPRLLVVDDEADQCTTLKALFTPKFTVEVANSAAEAVERFSFGDFDVAIIDWHMPNESGMSLARSVSRQMPYGQVFLYTADDTAGQQEGNAFRYISKSSEPEILEQLVTEAVTRSMIRSIVTLANSFPTFNSVSGPRRAILQDGGLSKLSQVGEDMRSWTACERSTAKFILHVAAPKANPFDLTELAFWDDHHRAAFLVWAKNPFWSSIAVLSASSGER